MFALRLISQGMVAFSSEVNGVCWMINELIYQKGTNSQKRCPINEKKLNSASYFMFSVTMAPSNTILGVKIRLIFRDPCRMCPSDTHISTYNAKLSVCADAAILALRNHDRCFYLIMGLSRFLLKLRRQGLPSHMRHM